MTYFAIVMVLVVGGERIETRGQCMPGGRKEAIAMLDHYDSVSSDAGGPLEMELLWADFEVCK